MFAKRILTSIAGLILFLAASPPTFPADVGEILTKVGDAYASLKTYGSTVSAIGTFEIDGIKDVMTTPPTDGESRQQLSDQFQRL